MTTELSYPVVTPAGFPYGVRCMDCGGGPDNTDPRKGRVTTDESNCWSGGCYRDWKVCIGPDLLVHVDNRNHTLKNSPECDS